MFYNKEHVDHDIRYLLISRGQHTVRVDHLGPRQKRACDGGTVRIFRVDLAKYNRSGTVISYCLGCGYEGPVARN